ncbi:MAG: DUF4168 domain-containing protein [Thermodesulfobacteriota bacterium]
MLNAKTLRRKATNWKFLALLVIAFSLVAAPPVAAQDYDQQGQGQGYEGQQGQQQEGQQGQQQKGQQQQQEYEYQEPSQQQEAKDFDEKNLEKFAEAKGELDEIRGEYSKELEGVDDAEQAQKLQEKYGNQMIESIKEKDLTVKKYNEISKAMQADPELQKKIEKLAN